jgi:hypothetical protein
MQARIFRSGRSNGNDVQVIIKPPDQAPLSCLRLAEILSEVFPPGVFNVLPGGVECGKALSSHRLVRKVTLIGSVPTGKAIARAAADTLKPTLFELGGKNALIAFPDADIDKLVVGVARGMYVRLSFALGAQLTIQELHMGGSKLWFNFKSLPPRVYSRRGAWQSC